MFKHLLAIVFHAFALLNALAACPGKVTSLHVRFIQRSLMVVPVMVNHTGPYDMVVDTGAQVTSIDADLARNLNLSSTSSAGVTGAGTFERDALVRLELVEASSQEIEGALAVVANLKQLQVADTNIRGVLGLNFLGYFDLLLDYSNGNLCLDSGEALEQKTSGEHISLLKSAGSGAALSFFDRFVIAVKVHGEKSGDLRMILDSGSNAPLVFHRAAIAADFSPTRAVLKRTIGSGAEQSFGVMETPDLQIGKHRFRRVPFVTPMDTKADVPQIEEDGLLPTVLFRSIFISSRHGYVVIEPSY